MKILPRTQLTVERLSLISDKPFASVLAAIRGGIGHPDMNKFWEEVWSADSFQKVESIVKPALGPTGLMQFGEFDDGGFIRKDRGAGTPQSMRLLIGNPLIMKQMTELVPDAAAYAPVTILIDEREGKVHISYDRMASLLSVYNNPEATRIAEALDAKIEALMHAAL
ncbi:MAG TPA: DUF302 domain-containing protein [Candidatus Acidoferrales bacterium]|jgi:hypothetical protein|nr:DUF302 domain-containing protein [Candidatus Acidoferrales bacterium]